MLSRFISKPSTHLRFFSLLISSQSNPNLPQLHNQFISNPPIQNPRLTFFNSLPKHFSTYNNNGDDDGAWKLSSEIEDSGALGAIFDEETPSQIDNNGDNHDTVAEAVGVTDDWVNVKDDDDGGDLFSGIEESVGEVGGGGGGDGDDNWATADGYEPWDLTNAGKEGEDVFEIGQSEVSGAADGEFDEVESEKARLEKMRLEKEEEELNAVLKGPNRAFGDLVATSGITEEMLESLIALKDLEGIEGLPPLTEIEDLRYEKNTRKSSRADIERQKQEEVANARVRQVDNKGRAYGTGRRKCSIARVWIQPGEGKFVVNDKHFDVYFPMLDQRAALLRPFSETKTLGQWDVNCTVKGGGMSGQVGAIRLGISKALQNWEPDLRPPLKEAGFLTRDARVVERKKPGKAKARKSFQWVKR